MTWTPERRARQAALIHSWRPWTQSTGPRTPEGKAKASRNADKGNLWGEIKAVRRLLNAEIRKAREIVSHAMEPVGLRMRHPSMRKP